MITRALENIFHRQKEAEAADIRLAEEIAALEKRQAAEQAAAEEAASSGDVDAYQAEKAKAERTAAEIHVKKAMKERASGITLEEVKPAWDEYITATNKALKKRRDAYESARFTACEKFREITRLQYEAYSIRKMCGEIVGLEMPFVAWGDHTHVYKDFPMDALEPKDYYFDAELYFHSGITCQEEYNTYNSMVSRHTV